MRVRSLVGVALAIAFLLPARGVAQRDGSDAAGQSERAPTEAPLVVLLAPRTGDDETIGARLVRAVQLDAPPAGQLRVWVLDAADDPARAYRDAVDAGAAAILGPVHAWRVDAVLAERREGDPPLFVLSSVEGVEDAAAQVARMRTSPADQAVAIASAALATSELRTVAVLAPDDGYGEESTLAFVRAMARWGGTVDRVVRYPAGEADVAAPLEWLAGQRREELVVPTDPWRTPPRARTVHRGGLRTRPDALFIPDFSDQIAVILPYLAFHRWRGEGFDDVFLLGLSGWGGPEVEWVGDLAAEAWITTVYRADDLRTASDAFALEYGVRFGDAPTELDAQTYDAAQFVYRAVLGGDARDTWLRAADLEHGGACGPMWLGEDGGVERELGLWQLDGAGRPYPIGPIERGEQ